MQFSPSSCYFLPLGSQYSQPLLSKNLYIFLKWLCRYIDDTWWMHSTLTARTICHSYISTVSVYLLPRREFPGWPERYTPPDAAPCLPRRCGLFQHLLPEPSCFAARRSHVPRRQRTTCIFTWRWAIRELLSPLGCIIYSSVEKCQCFGGNCWLHLQYILQNIGVHVSIYTSYL